MNIFLISDLHFYTPISLEQIREHYKQIDSRIN